MDTASPEATSKSKFIQSQGETEDGMIIYSSSETPIPFPQSQDPSMAPSRRQDIQVNTRIIKSQHVQKRVNIMKNHPNNFLNINECRIDVNNSTVLSSRQANQKQMSKTFNNGFITVDKGSLMKDRYWGSKRSKNTEMTTSSMPFLS